MFCVAGLGPPIDRLSVGVRAARRAPGPASGCPDPTHTRRVTPSEGVYCKPSKQPHEKGPLNVQAFGGPNIG